MLPLGVSQNTALPVVFRDPLGALRKASAEVQADRVFGVLITIYIK